MDEGERLISEARDYNSHNTERLDLEGMKILLMKLEYLQLIIKGDNVWSDD